MSPLLELVAVHKAFSPNEPAILRGDQFVACFRRKLGISRRKRLWQDDIRKADHGSPSAYSGKVLYKGQDLRTMSKKEYQAYRLKVQNDPARFLCGT